MKQFFYSGLVIILCCGCSAQHWGGDTAGQRPGVKFKSGLFYGASIEMTSDGTASLDNLSITKSKDGYSVAMNGLNLTQTPSVDTIAEVDKLKAIADLQAVQVAYMKEVMSGLATISEALVPMVGSWQQLIAWGVGQRIVAQTQSTTQPAK